MPHAQSNLTHLTRAYALRADVLLRAGEGMWTNYPEAVRRSREDGQKAIDLAQNLPAGYRVVSQIQAEVDSNCPEAEESLKKALERAPEDSDTLALSGRIAMCQGRLEEAVTLTQQALQADPLRPLELTFLGQYLRDLGRYEEAHAALQRALDLNPNGSSLIEEVRGEVYLAQGKPKEALEQMEKEPAGYLHELGLRLAYFALGRKAESDEALGKTDFFLNTQMQPLIRLHRCMATVANGMRDSVG